MVGDCLLVLLLGLGGLSCAAEVPTPEVNHFELGSVVEVELLSSFRDGGSANCRLITLPGDSVDIHFENGLDSKEPGQMTLLSGREEGGGQIARDSQAEREVATRLTEWLDRNFKRSESGEVVAGLTPRMNVRRQLSLGRRVEFVLRRGEYFAQPSTN